MRKHSTPSWCGLQTNIRKPNIDEWTRKCTKLHLRLNEHIYRLWERYYLIPNSASSTLHLVRLFFFWLRCWAAAADLAATREERARQSGVCCSCSSAAKKEKGSQTCCWCNQFKNDQSFWKGLNSTAPIHDPPCWHKKNMSESISIFPRLENSLPIMALSIIQQHKISKEIF